MVAQVFGGLGLFLLGMWLMSEGLKLAAGEALKDLLARWTSERWRGFAVGLGVTGLVQSSSAVSMAIIGFANAGLLTLNQAIWVLYGANVGTTAIGWIVQLLGFRLDVGLFAMPLVGVGMAMRLGFGGRRAALGQALAGFGVLFLGIEALKLGFEGAAASFALPSFEGTGPLTLIAYLAAGTVLTALMQSSSAVLVMAMSALSSGLLSLPQAAALMLGATIGTTTDAVFASIGATPTAKRVASAHILFAVLSAALGFVLIEPLLAGLGAALGALGRNPDGTLALVAFFTSIKLVGVLVAWPLTPALTRALNRRFLIPEAEQTRPRYLDRNVMQVPSLAIAAALRETARLGEITTTAIRAWLAAPDDTRALDKAMDVTRILADRIAAFLSDLSARTLGPQDVVKVQVLMRTLQHDLAAFQDAQRGAQTRRDSAGIPPERSTLEAEIRAALDHPELLDKAMENALKARRDSLKEDMLAAVTARRLSIADLDHNLRGMNAELRMLRHLRKAGRYVADFGQPGAPPLEDREAVA